VAALAQSLDIRSTALFHHEPVRTDDQLDALSKLHCHPGESGRPKIFFAREGMRVTL